MMSLVWLSYKCRCSWRERKIGVEPRGEGVELREWLECVVMVCIAADHRVDKPACKENGIEYLRIGNQKITPDPNGADA